MNRSSLVTAVAIAATSCSAVAAQAASTAVNLRIEGASQTIFEGPVTTDGRLVRGHPCDGTSSTQPPQAPGATVGAALDDAALASGFSWTGNWQNNTFGGVNYGDDFFIPEIGGETASGGQFWGLYRNEGFADHGACQQQVSVGDRIVFALANGGEQLLSLASPSRATVGQSVTLLVTEHDGLGATVPSAGASVGGRTTGADGRVIVQFSSPGFQSLKATKAGAIRSNRATVCVQSVGGNECEGVPDTPLSLGGVAPQAAVPADRRKPTAHIASVRRGQRFHRRGPKTFRGKVADETAVMQVYLRLRRASGGRCRWFSGKREVFTDATSCAKARFFRIGDDAAWSYQLASRLGPGSYVLEVKVLDKASNAGTDQVRFQVVK